MSDQQQSVWPDGAREAVTDALRRDSVLGGMVPLEDQLLTALEPFVQQRIEAAERLIAALHVAGADGRAAWDADQDVRAGKLLAAIEGTRGIRVELDNIRAAWLLSRLPQQEKAR